MAVIPNSKVWQLRRWTPTPELGVEEMPEGFSLLQHGITVTRVHRNPAVPVLYEQALATDTGAAITDTGALVALSGQKTGRTPKDKRIVAEASSENEIWWGSVNMRLDREAFVINRQRALDFLNTREQLFVIDGFAGWDPKYRLKVRVICARPYHALFMHNMLIRPSVDELETFGEPDYVILNSGQFPANVNTKGMTSDASICLSFEEKQLVILGSQYAGEMKKGIFTVMHYLMPKRDVLSMHCSATEGANGDTSVLFGLSGTGKTTLSADPKRQLIGDDEHCWSQDGIFNIEGGCYAKMINLSPEQEPEIYNALKFGSVLENVVYDDVSRAVKFDDVSITQNTRGSYPIEYIPSAKLPCVGGHPNHVIFLTCDAFGVLPPVSKLTSAQAMYHFISGYTAKVAGTEVGITEPEATFSPCFGGPFLVHHPARYAELLAKKMEHHGATGWLVNTGWSGGAYGTGSRMSLRHTRAIIDAIHSGELLKSTTVTDPVFGVAIPTECPGVPSAVLQPRATWGSGSDYDETARKLAHLFVENFKQYAAGASDAIMLAGPKL